MKIKRDIPTHSYHRDAYIAAWKLRKTTRLSGAKIARRLGVKVETVNLWLRAKWHKRNTLTQPQPYYRDAFIKALKLRKTKRLSGSEIARRLGLNKKTVSMWLRDQKNNDAVRVHAGHIAKYQQALSLMHTENLTPQAIAQRIRVPYRLIRYWFKKEQEHAKRDE